MFKVFYFDQQIVTREGQGVVIAGLSSVTTDARNYIVAFGYSGEWLCRTNNNQVCYNAQNAPCVHVRVLMEETLKRLAPQDLRKLLDLDDLGTLDPLEIVKRKSATILRVSDQVSGVSGSAIMHRAIRYLLVGDRPCEGPIPEMVWFPSPKPKR